MQDPHERVSCRRVTRPEKTTPSAGFARTYCWEPTNISEEEGGLASAGRDGSVDIRGSRHVVNGTMLSANRQITVFDFTRLGLWDTRNGGMGVI